MADIKKRMLILSTGRKLKLFGTCIGIAKTLEIGECYAPNILSIPIEQTDTLTLGVLNPHQLTEFELMEIADLYIKTWVEFKDNIRAHGIDSPKLFNRE